MSMHATAQSNPVVGYWPDGRMQIFTIDENGAVITSWKTSTHPNAAWSNWISLGGQSTGPLTVGSLPDNRMQLFSSYVAPDGTVRVSTIWQAKGELGLTSGKWVEMGSWQGGYIFGVSAGYLPAEN